MAEFNFQGKLVSVRYVWIHGARLDTRDGVYYDGDTRRERRLNLDRFVRVMGYTMYVFI